MKFNRKLTNIVSIIISVLLTEVLIYPHAIRNPEGIWIMQDSQGASQAEITVKIIDNKLVGKITRILKGNPDARCVDCEGKLKNRRVLGILLFWGLKYNNGKWEDGYILAIKRGKIFKCSADISENEMKIKVSLGFFSQTIVWKRKH